MMPRCAWCGRPGKTFVAFHSHCGSSHLRSMKMASKHVEKLEKNGAQAKDITLAKRTGK